jgi:redox-sensitive bicupin YhaK (pirin superfamily)
MPQPNFVNELLVKGFQMKKKVTAIYSGLNSRVGDFLVNRLLPGNHIQSIGPMVFLDHIYPATLKKDRHNVPTGEFAHPHRGIATFSYVFNGSLAHFDSRGNHDAISAGGFQWMKAGNGIIHDEQPFATAEFGELFHSLQFWINLPAAVKLEEPEYLAVQAEHVPEINLPNDIGVLRVLIGEFGCTVSPVKTFSKQFIYHIRLNPKASFNFRGKPGLEYGVFIPSSDILVNDRVVGKSKLITFAPEDDEIFLENPNIQSADVLIFGGDPYTDPIVAEGPFVMNSSQGIAEAYRDFFDGKYGTINYNTR